MKTALGVREYRLLQHNTSWREELAWAAGFVDGEGSFSLSQKKLPKRADISPKMYTRLTIGQTERSTLDRIKEALLGLGTIGGPYIRNPKHSPIYTYAVYDFESVQAAMALLWPFLSEPKRAQYKAAQAASKFKDRSKCINGHLLKGINVFYASRVRGAPKYPRCRTCVRKQALNKYYKDKELGIKRVRSKRTSN